MVESLTEEEKKSLTELEQKIMERSLLDTFEELKEINCTVWCWKHMLKAGGKVTDAQLELQRRYTGYIYG